MYQMVQIKPLTIVSESELPGMVKTMNAVQGAQKESNKTRILTGLVFDNQRESLTVLI